MQTARAPASPYMALPGHTRSYPMIYLSRTVVFLQRCTLVTLQTGPFLANHRFLPGILASTKVVDRWAVGRPFYGHFYPPASDMRILRGWSACGGGGVFAGQNRGRSSRARGAADVSGNTAGCRRPSDG